jgi:hypothetical protein
MLDNNINPYIKKNNNKIILHKNQIIDFIRPINYTWRQFLKMMNKIKTKWRFETFNINYSLELQELHKIIYTNLKHCIREPNLNLKNKIIESDINSFFQSNLLEILPKEKKLYDLYDNLFANKKYIPKKDERNKAIFGDFIIKFKDFYYRIEKSDKSMKQLKKMRWYMIFDEDNFFEDEFTKKKANLFNSNNNNFFLFLNQNSNLNDSFDEIERKTIYNTYKEIENNKIEDNLEEIHEKYIINDELINKLLKQEKNPFFYLIKLMYISIKIFCKCSISHLLYKYHITEETKREERKAILIHEYLKFLNNFVDTCTIIDEKCVNINLAMNYLYESIFKDYPKFPKFSIYRMCLKIWFSEINTHLIGKNTLLFEIKEILSSIFSETLKENLLNKMDINNNMFSMHTKSVLSEKSKTFNLSTPFSLFKSINLSCTEQINNNIYPNLESLNVYDNEDRQYKILEKGLSIINDTFSNEYSVYFLNSSIIDTNIFYDNLVSNLENSIKYYISEVFNVYIYEKNSCVKYIIENIFNYFDNYFYKSFIIPNLRNQIYETVYLCVKHNLLEFTKNKYLQQYSNIKESNNINKSNNTNSMLSSAKTNDESNLKSSSIFDLNNDEFGNDINFQDNNEIKNDEYKKEIINYIVKNIQYDFNNTNIYNQVEQNLESINEQINLYDSCTSICNWHKDRINIIKENDKLVIEEILKMKNVINIPLIYDQTKRYLLSYSLQYDWDFIRKVKTLQKYYLKNNDDTDMIEDDNLENDLGNNYLGELDNIGQGNGNFGNGGFNLKSSFFDC